MSVTKLKTVGNWQTVHRQRNAVAERRTKPSGTPNGSRTEAREPGGDRGTGAINEEGDWGREHVRGRVITGMLSGGDTRSDAASVAQDQRTERDLMT